MTESQSEKLDKMSDQELLNTFYENGGRVTDVGFESPMPISFDTSKCSFAIGLLMGRKTGNDLLFEQINRFSRGEIDDCGKVK